MAALVHELSANTDTPQAFQDPTTGKKTLQSIDRVMHFGDDGKLHSYSSKPPLLVWLYAAVYGVVHVLTGTSVYDMPLWCGRWTIAAAHLAPLAFYWWLLIDLIRRATRSDFAFWILALAAVFGTHLTPFAVTVNNHLPGAICALVTLKLALMALSSKGNLWHFGGAGTLAASCVVCELPALSWCAMVGGILLLAQPRRTFVAFLPMALLVAIAATVSNYWTHGSWRPPYAHRGLGEALQEFPTANEKESAITLPQLVVGEIPAESKGPAIEDLKPWLTDKEPELAWEAWQIVPSLRSAHWELRGVDVSDGSIVQRFALVPVREGELTAGELRWKLHAWDDWYDHPGTYWTERKITGVDKGEPSRIKYAFHSLLGHHGVFSLTPIFLLSLGSLFYARRESIWEQRLIYGIQVVTLVCLVFYWSRSQIDRNYGGVSCTFRWLLWLVPLWLWIAGETADRWSVHRWGRVGMQLLLAVSVFSAFSAISNPWQHPWLYRLSDYLGWIAAG